MASGFETRLVTMSVEVKIEIPVSATIQEPDLIEAAQGCVENMYMHRVVRGEDAVYLRCLPSIKECEVMVGDMSTGFGK